MPGPWKPWNEAEAGEYTQLGYEFLYNMFAKGMESPRGDTGRDISIMTVPNCASS